MADLNVISQETIGVIAEPRRHAAEIIVFERVFVTIDVGDGALTVSASQAVGVTDTPAVEPTLADLNVGILWLDLTLWVQGVKVSGA